MMTTETSNAFLDRLEAGAIEAWLEGGWGVDALLGEQTRPHDDLDLIVRVDDVPRMREALEQDGFAAGRGCAELELRAARRLWPLGRRASGPLRRRPETVSIGWRTAKTGSIRRAALPERDASGRRVVKCLTPDVQMLCHATGYEPGWTDFHDMRLLNARFGTPLLPPYDGRRAPSGPAARRSTAPRASA